MKDLTRKIIAAVVLTAVFCGIAGAGLTGKIDSLLRQSSQRSVRFSVRIVEAATARELYSHNARTPLIPASNMKAIVSAATLHYLGGDYEYSTVVALSGRTLVVIGAGDPLLGDEKTDALYGREPGWIFADITSTLKANRISDLKAIVVDSAFFDQQRVHPNWSASELNRWYACEISGLNFNDNCIMASARRTSGGVAVSLEPNTSFISFTNKVTSISSGSGVLGSYRSTTTPNKIVIHGTCLSEVGPIDIAIEQPALYFGHVLAEHLGRSGITISDGVTENAYGFEGDLEPLAVYVTPLSDCLRRCNKDSLGLVAESMMKTFAAEYSPGRLYGSWTVGRLLVGRYLKSMGVDESEFVIDDGSGLSRENRLSANALSAAILDIHQSSNRDLLVQSLAIGGVDGTISKYFRESKYKGKVRAKTGYISGVKALSGVCETDAGDYIFSIIANRTTGDTRTAMYDIVKAVIDEYSADGSQ